MSDDSDSGGRLGGELLRNSSLKGLTSKTCLALATPDAISHALSLIGIGWEPKPYSEADDEVYSGLYAWVDGSPSSQPDLRQHGVLYWGIGEDQVRGVRRRLRNEDSWIGAEADHGHGMAMFRRQARPLVAPVVPVADSERETVLGALESTRGADIARRWLSEGHLLRRTEHLAIRLSIHIGDVGAPVQSTHAGAWASDHGADWTAWALAKYLRDLTSAVPDPTRPQVSGTG